jgi:hypothetical protein
MTPRRLVLMRIDSEDDADRVRRVHASFAAIPGVRCALSVGRAAATDGVPGFTHLSIFEFADAAARAAYRVHPLHLGAREAVRSRVSDVVVVDVD